MGQQFGYILAAVLLYTSLETCRSFLLTGVVCDVCAGGLCGVIPGRDPVMRCPEATPYCLNIIENDSKGSRHVTKRCGSKRECEDQWWLETSSKDVCTKFKADNFYPFSFSCTFCCTLNRCNKDLFPGQNTLFVGDDM